MGWSILLLIAGVIIFFFLRDRDRMLASSVDSEGGMKNKYSELVAWLTSDPNTKIIKTTRDHLTISAQLQTVRTDFFLTENFDGLDVEWVSDFGNLGKHQLKWNFRKDMAQRDIIVTIGTDLHEFELKFFK